MSLACARLQVAVVANTPSTTATAFVAFKQSTKQSKLAIESSALLAEQSIEVFSTEAKPISAEAELF